jgi:hypothetical protein
MWLCVDLALTDASEESIGVQPPAHAGFPTRGFFYPENGGDMFLRYVAKR